jgi:hypothetical protein
MKMTELREKAKAIGISPGKMKKAELIHSVQKAEGYTRCFGTSGGFCANNDCCFMKDCLKVKDEPAAAFSAECICAEP